MTIRVQLVAGKIPAYQKDFDNQIDALLTAERLANGGNMPRVESTDLARYQIGNMYVRAFELTA